MKLAEILGLISIICAPTAWAVALIHSSTHIAFVDAHYQALFIGIFIFGLLAAISGLASTQLGGGRKAFALWGLTANIIASAPVVVLLFYLSH